MTAPDLAVARGPRWTRKRLVDMLIACYGPSRSGGVRYTAVANYLQVSPSTVRHWTRPAAVAPAARAPIPADRLAQLQRGPEAVEKGAQRRYRYALDAVDKIQAGRIVNPHWETAGWLTEHTVTITQLKNKPWQQVAATGNSARARTELARRGEPLQQIAVPTHFHAEALTWAVMHTMQQWRVHPDKEQLASGATTVWMHDAPIPNLAEIAAEVFGR